MNIGAIFNSIPHAYASTAKLISKEARSLAKVLHAIATSEKVVEGGTAAILGVVDPIAAVAAVRIEQLAYAALGTLAHAVDSTEVAASKGFVNVTLDAQAFEDFKQVAAYLKEALKNAGTPISGPGVVAHV